MEPCTSTESWTPFVLSNRRTILESLIPYLSHNSSSFFSMTDSSFTSAEREIENNNYYWFIRVQQLLNTQLPVEIQRTKDWKIMYKFISVIYNPSVLENLLRSPDVEVVDLGLLLGANPTLGESTEGIIGGENALMYACDFGHANVVGRLLLDKRVDPTSYENSAIIFAVTTGNLEVVKVLLKDERVSANTDDVEGKSCLMIACENGDIEMVKLFLNMEDIDTDRTLYYCLNDPEIFKLILKHERFDINNDCNCYIIEEVKDYNKQELVNLILEDERYVPREEETDVAVDTDALAIMSLETDENED